jgi:hypothetical protein
MRCDSWASLLAHTLTNPCLGREPKVRVATLMFDMLRYGTPLCGKIVTKQKKKTKQICI